MQLSFNNISHNNYSFEVNNLYTDDEGADLYSDDESSDIELSHYHSKADESKLNSFLGFARRTISQVNSNIVFGLGVANTYLFNHHSPWALANKINKQVELGMNPPAIISKNICDLGHLRNEKSYWRMLLATGNIWRKVHVVTDAKLIKEGLKYPRNGDLFSSYPTTIDQVINDPHNMLTCQGKDHYRLRKPYEKIFSVKGIEDILLAGLAHDLIDSNFSSLRLGPLKLRDISASDLTVEEIISSAHALDIASGHTTAQTRLFSKTLLYAFPQWREKIIEDWENAFGKIEEEPLEEVKDWSIGYARRLKKREKSANRLIAFVRGGEWNGKQISPSSALHAFVLEVLRLYPIVPYMVRIANENLQLGETQIKQGDAVVFNILGYQRGDAIFGENLMEFNPGRFMKEGAAPNILKDHLDILNFSAGPQHCIGKNLARYMLLLATAADAIVASLEGTEISSKAYLHGVIDTILLNYPCQAPILKDCPDQTLPLYKFDGPFLSLDGQLVRK